MVLVIVRVVAAVVLLELEVEHDTIGERERFLGDKDRLARNVAAAGSGVDPPGRVAFSINRVFNRAVDAFVAAVAFPVFRLELGFEQFFCVGVVRRCLDEFNFDFVGWDLQIHRFHLELAQRGHAFDRAARAAAGQVWVGQLFELEGADERQIICAAEMRGPLRRRVARGADRAVGIVIEALAVFARIAALHDHPFRLVVFDRVLPSVHALLPIGRGVAQPGFEIAHLPGQVRDEHLLLGRVGDQRGLVVVVQERKQAVILLLRQRIEFMVVALGALNRKPKNTLADAIHSVEQSFHPELLGVHAAFLVQHRIAEKSGRDEIVLPRIWQLIAGDLFDDEPVVGQVLVERVDNPVAIRPDETRLVLLKTI